MSRRAPAVLAFVLALAGVALAGADPEARFQRLSEELKLTDQQKLKVLLCMQAEDRKIHAIRQEKSLTDEKKDAQVEAAHRQAEEEIRQVLTPAQRVRFAAMRDDGAPAASEDADGSR